MNCKNALKKKKKKTISLDLSAQNCRFLYMFLQREFGPSH